jgi:hypothetical protein
MTYAKPILTHHGTAVSRTAVCICNNSSLELQSFTLRMAHVATGGGRDSVDGISGTGTGGDR